MKVRHKKIASFLLAGVLFSLAGVVIAQQTLPKGGDGFEAAVKLELGSYQRETLEENEYFYAAGIKPGQEINIKYTFGAGTGNDGWATLDLYDEDRTKLSDKWDTVSKGESNSITVSWLPNTDKDSYKYYIKAGYDGYDVGPISFVISLTDYYDAGTQTDAGDSFGKAMSITPGEYEGYLLSGVAGTDTKDFYKVTVKKGETLIAKVTPPAEVALSVIIYDSSRRELKEEYSPNLGAIVTNSVPITKSGDVFVAVVCGEYHNKEFKPYSLNIATGAGKVIGEGLTEKQTEEAAEQAQQAGEEVKSLIERGIKGILLYVVLPIVGGIILLIVIIVVIVIILKKKKEKDGQGSGDSKQNTGEKE